MTKGKKSKDPYAGLSQEYRAAIEGSSEEEIQKRLSEVALELQNIRDDQEADADYQKAKEALKYAGEQYRERNKQVKLKAKFIKRVLQSRGRA